MHFLLPVNASTRAASWSREVVRRSRLRRMDMFVSLRGGCLCVDPVRSPGEGSLQLEDVGTSAVWRNAESQSRTRACFAFFGHGGSLQRASQGVDGRGPSNVRSVTVG